MKFNAIQLQDDSFFVVTETVKGQKRGRQFGTHEEAHAFAVQMTVEYHLKKANELMSEGELAMKVLLFDRQELPAPQHFTPIKYYFNASIRVEILADSPFKKGDTQAHLYG